MTTEAETAEAPQVQEQVPAADESRDSILAGMKELANAPLEAGEVDLTQTSEPDEAAQEEVAEAEEVDPDAEVEEEAEPEVEAAPTEADATLEKIQQAEKRSKERLADHMASERAAFAKEREDHSAALERAQKIEADHEAAQRRYFDPTGKSSAELLAYARQMHALSIAENPDADPAEKAKAQRTVKEREIEDRLSAAEKRAEAAEAKWKERDEAQANQAQAQKVTETLVSAVNDESPFTQSSLSGKGAAQAKERLLNIAAALFQQSGEMPDAVDVIKYFEEAERERLTDLGLDPDLVLKTSKKTKTKTPVAGEKTSAPTLGNDLTTSTQPRAEVTMSQEELDADIKKGMANLGT